MYCHNIKQSCYTQENSLYKVIMWEMVYILNHLHFKHKLEKKISEIFEEPLKSSKLTGKGGYL